MARLLLIDPDDERRAILRRRLGQAGYLDVVAVDSGSIALTMIERDRPDLIVSRARAGDLDGWELCGIVRSDPTLGQVRFLLLVDPDEPVPPAPAGVPDRVLVGDLMPTAVIAAVRGLVPDEPGRGDGGPAGVRGSLDIMDVADVAQAIALGGKSGQLVVGLSTGRGLVVFDRGRVVHAEFAGLTGEPAFAALLSASHRGGDFCFNPGAPGRGEGGRTIHRSLESLLLTAAAGIDEGLGGGPA